MNSIERRFRKIAEANPQWSAYVCLAEAVGGHSYNRKTMRRNFLNLVPKEDYEKDIERELVVELERLLKPRKNVQNEG
jgi:hypothetical protein